MDRSTSSLPHRRAIRDMPDPEFHLFAQALGYHVAIGAMRAVATGVIWLSLVGVAIGVCVLDLSPPP